MLVLKFGGTSVGTSERMRDVLSILNRTEEQQMVVLSAMAGTTNALVEINAELREHRIDSANSMLETCLLYTSPSPRDRTRSRMPSSA